MPTRTNIVDAAGWLSRQNVQCWRHAVPLGIKVLIPSRYSFTTHGATSRLNHMMRSPDRSRAASYENVLERRLEQLFWLDRRPFLYQQHALQLRHLGWLTALRKRGGYDGNDQDKAAVLWRREVVMTKIFEMERPEVEFSRFPILGASPSSDRPSNLPPLQVFTLEGPSVRNFGDKETFRKRVAAFAIRDI
jgi:hypothetical protein